MPTDALVKRWPLWLSVAALLAFLVGGLIPGALRAAIEQRLHLPFAVPPVAHFLLSGVMAAGLRWCRPAWPLAVVLLVVLAIGGLAEVAQVWVPGRQPSWGDLGLDLAGTVTGLIVAASARRLAAFIGR
ncbi:VanZ family protein [Halomonas sp. M4R1S46]|uniref:VanZ family protein n=1 Tax=Halomonas sp. M4R1S46 TaxID=2982692 RepID=UPI0021E3ED25|nr:VanZ family protein [Halomonas sp. M4R1S46]UYG06050.1 VanZ family protein [Halomonas sp. M4R1S46]